MAIFLFKTHVSVSLSLHVVCSLKRYLRILSLVTHMYVYLGLLSQQSA